MIDLGKKNLLGVLIDCVDYDGAVRRIIEASTAGRPLAVSALAVHGVMTGVEDTAHRYRLNHLDLVTPDGQPVRWGLNVLHRVGLKERVYGPTLMLRTCEAAAASGLPIYLYGSTQDILTSLCTTLGRRFPELLIAGAEPSKFRQISKEEKAQVVDRIRESGARIVFVGLGCPRQEVFAYEYRDALECPVIAVGAAFDYHSGTLREPPAKVQSLGLQWLYRLLQEPRRLWKRYLILNPKYLSLLFAQSIKLWRPKTDDAIRPSHQLLYG